MKITRDSHPALSDAFEEVALPDMETSPDTPVGVIVPDELVHLVAPAETGLARLKAHSGRDWYDFLHGDDMAAADIRERCGNLDEAETLLRRFHAGWDGDTETTRPSHDHG